MSEFIDNNEDAITELFEEQSTYGDDSDAAATFLGHLDNLGVDDMDEAEDYISSFDDNYRGTYSGEAEFAEELSIEIGDLTHVPDYIKSCIDWEEVWDKGLCYDVNSYWLPSGKYGFVWIH